MVETSTYMTRTKAIAKALLSNQIRMRGIWNLIQGKIVDETKLSFAIYIWTLKIMLKSYQLMIKIIQFQVGKETDM